MEYCDIFNYQTNFLWGMNQTEQTLGKLDPSRPKHEVHKNTVGKPTNPCLNGNGQGVHLMGARGPQIKKL